MKKIFAVALVAALAVLAGAVYFDAAEARGQGGRGGYGGGNSHCDYSDGRGGNMRGNMRGFGGGFGYNNQYQNQNFQFSDEMIAKFAEIQKLNIDLNTELRKNSVDKTKALEIYNKIRTERQAVADWRFNQYLESLK